MKLRVLAVVLLIAGCTSDDYQGQAGSRTLPIGPSFVSDDSLDLYDANIAVNLSASAIDWRVECGGVLVTRTRVLTASHCVVGVDTLTVGPSPPVSVGSVFYQTTEGGGFATETPPISPISELGHFTDPDNFADVGGDLAILAIDEKALIAGENLGRPPPVDAGLSLSPDGGYSSAVDSSSWGSLLGTNIVHLSFASPSNGHVGMSTWGGSTQRQLHMLDFYLGLHQDFSSMEGSGAVPGDSGSPLFAIHADGARETFGIVSGGDETGDVFFVNLTSPRNSGWIASQLTDHTHDAQSNWQKMHPLLAGRTAWWIGEDEYSGPCDSEHDDDCDHWTDAHDNCPSVFNHDQADRDDDGVGDACPQ